MSEMTYLSVKWNPSDYVKLSSKRTLRLPSSFLRYLDLKAGHEFRITTCEGHIVLIPAKTNPLPPGEKR